MSTADTSAYLTYHNGGVRLRTGRGRPLLDMCDARLRTPDGRAFTLSSLPHTVRTGKQRLTIQTTAIDGVPQLRWQAVVVQPDTLRLTLRVTNTTGRPLGIEQLDPLICPEGYQRLPIDKLTARQTGWQMSSPAGLRTTYADRDPWAQPPLYMPQLPDADADSWELPWMGVLQAGDGQPLLIGFEQARDYLGMIRLRPATRGHRLTASNYLESTVVLQAGESCSTEPLIVAWGAPEAQLLDRYASLVGQAMHARIPASAPTGWSSWLYYFEHVTEKDILENTTVIQERGLPLEYIQVDDGYQTHFGDWLSINDKFPHGMQYIAEAITAAGRKPGIWLAPFMADSRSQVVRDHPEWFLHDTQGTLLDVNRSGDTYWQAANYGLDLTHPDAYAWLKEVLTTLCETWGYQYLKIDFLYAGAVRAVRYDPACTSVQAYRRGLELIREVAGGRLILGCGAPFLCSVGLVDTMRIGPDLSWTPRKPSLTGLRNRDPLLSLLSHQWMDRKLWRNDADYVRVRQKDIDISWPQTVALTSVIALGGGALYQSDKLAAVEPEGMQLLDRLFPVADGSFEAISFTAAGKPEKLRASYQRGDSTWHVALRFNWQHQPRTSRFIPARWHLPAGRYHAYDLHAQKYHGLHAYHQFGDIGPDSASMYSLCPASNRPQLIATEGHLLGPAGDIKSTSWRRNTLTITLTEGRRTATKLIIAVPHNYRLVSERGCSLSQHEGTIYTYLPEQSVCTLVFRKRLTTNRTK